LFFVGVVQALLHNSFFLYVGPLHFYLYDIFLISFLISFFVLTFERKKLAISMPIEIKLLCIYTCVIVVHVAIGWHNYHTAAIVNSRAILYALSIMIAIGIRPTTSEEYKKIFISILIIALLYMLIAYLRWFEIIGKTVFAVQHEGTWVGERLLNRSQAVFLVFGSILVIAALMLNKIRINILPISYLFFAIVAIVLCQIRSIWIISICSLALLFFFRRISLPKALISIYWGIVISCIIYQIVVSANKFDLIKAALMSATHYNESSTFYWRNVVSAEYLNYMQTVSYLVGTHFGDLPLIKIGSSVGQWGLHNNYVEVFYYGGLVGFIAFYSAYCSVLYRLNVFLNKEQQLLMQFFSLFFLVSLFVYLIFYFNWTIDILNAVLIGLSISFVNNQLIDKEAESL